MGMSLNFLDNNINTAMFSPVIAPLPTLWLSRLARLLPRFFITFAQALCAAPCSMPARSKDRGHQISSSSPESAGQKLKRKMCDAEDGKPLEIRPGMTATVESSSVAS